METPVQNTEIQTPRDKVVARILKLRALGSSNTSEAEAFASFEKAEEMMRAYRIEEAELAMAETSGKVVLEIISRDQMGVSKNGRVRHAARRTHWNINQFCDVKSVYWDDVGKITWVGHRPDVEFAMWLAQVIHDAMDHEYTRWRRTQAGVGHGAKASFQAAMASRINQRLSTLTAPPAAAAAAPTIKTGRDLIIVEATEAKRRETTKFHKELFPKLGKGRGFGHVRSGGSAFSAGYAAGDRVGFGRPVSQGHQRALAS